MNAVLGPLAKRAWTPPPPSTLDAEAEGEDAYAVDVYTQVSGLRWRVSALEADRKQLRGQLLELKTAAAQQNKSAAAGGGEGGGVCRVCRLDASLPYCAVTGTRHRSTEECTRRIREQCAKYEGFTDDALRKNPSLAHVLHFCAFPPEGEDGVGEATAAAHKWLAAQQDILLCLDCVQPLEESAPFSRFCSADSLQRELKAVRQRREARSEAG